MSKWVVHHGSDEKPIPDGLSYRVRFRDGEELTYKPNWAARWTNTDHSHDIVAYKILEDTSL